MEGHRPTFPSIRYPIPTQETGNTLVTPLKFRMSMGGGDNLLSGASQPSPSRQLLLHGGRRACEGDGDAAGTYKGGGRPLMSGSRVRAFASVCVDYGRVYADQHGPGGRENLIIAKINGSRLFPKAYTETTIVHAYDIHKTPTLLKWVKAKARRYQKKKRARGDVPTNREREPSFGKRNFAGEKEKRGKRDGGGEKAPISSRARAHCRYYFSSYLALCRRGPLKFNLPLPQYSARAVHAGPPAARCRQISEDGRCGKASTTTRAIGFIKNWNYPNGSQTESYTVDPESEILTVSLDIALTFLSELAQTAISKYSIPSQRSLIGAVVKRAIASIAVMEYPVENPFSRLKIRPPPADGPVAG
ncbi:hypothetical protein EVAR_14383_1 [Eumeta japonica]|uniref:Uncharacterized protein n=1 Tax=Eumeta variegata TaxID=151549 RepID=A0A4C1TX29_EUMVA|nr:hypothetical protein EVAR_14383_1 [Eumeta japonica]